MRAGAGATSRRTCSRPPAAPYPHGRQLGDLVVCAPVVAREARKQGEPVAAHWAHMIVHGTLHLLGFDHERATDAKRMEGRERALLARIGTRGPLWRLERKERRKGGWLRRFTKEGPRDRAELVETPRAAVRGGIIEAEACR